MTSLRQLRWNDMEHVISGPPRLNATPYQPYPGEEILPPLNTRVAAQLHLEVIRTYSHLLP